MRKLTGNAFLALAFMALAVTGCGDDSGEISKGSIYTVSALPPPAAAKAPTAESQATTTTPPATPPEGKWVDMPVENDLEILRKIVLLEPGQKSELITVPLAGATAYYWTLPDTDTQAVAWINGEQIKLLASYTDKLLYPRVSGIMRVQAQILPSNGKAATLILVLGKEGYKPKALVEPSVDTVVAQLGVWKESEIIPRDGDVIEYGTFKLKSDVARLQVRTGGMEPVTLKPVETDSGEYIGRVTCTGPNSVRDKTRVMLLSGDTLVVTIRKRRP